MEIFFMIKAVIIDNDAESRQSVQSAIAAYCPNVSVVAVADSVKAGVAAINEYEPDLVLLEVRMQDGSGFDVIKHFNKPDFRVIFITGYIEYAITGYKYNAVDYILKPIVPEELAVAVNRADDMIRFEGKLRFKALVENFRPEKGLDKLILRTSDHVHLVMLQDIIRIEADGNYSSFYLEDGRMVVISKAIGDYETELIDKGFFRVHKSHLININKMRGFSKSEGGDVIMKDGSKVPVASRKRSSLLEIFDAYT